MTQVLRLSHYPNYMEKEGNIHEIMKEMQECQFFCVSLEDMSTLRNECDNSIMYFFEVGKLSLDEYDRLIVRTYNDESYGNVRYYMAGGFYAQSEHYHDLLDIGFSLAGELVPDPEED